MAKSRSQERKSAQLSIQEISNAIPKLERRLLDLESFDAKSIQRRADPDAAALATKVNETLKQIFGHDTIEFMEYSVTTFDSAPIYYAGDGPSLGEVQQGYHDSVNRCITTLRTLRDLFHEQVTDAESNISSSKRTNPTRQNNGHRVFVVHGHNESAKESVARYLEKLRLKPVILHEEPNEGRTIIEKFEACSDVAFAVVLLTPDDAGHPTNKPNESKSRARQNVIFELGFFTGALGRNRVCALYVNDVELPSDFSGVLYHVLDTQGAWRLLLAKELKAAGLPVDMNLAL